MRSIVVAFCSLSFAVAQQEPAPKPPTAAAQEPASLATPAEQADPVLRALKWQSGKVQVGDLASMALPAGWRYLASRDARTVLEKVWNNPEDTSTLGLVFPPGAGPRESHFAVVVSFEDEGYVKDDDAAGLDYTSLLHDMQEDTKSGNADRKRNGYPQVQLLGWAEPPHYDAKEKKLYWAKKLQFEGSEGPELNYDVRILGRHGYLVLTALSSAEQLPAVASGCKELLAVTNFLPGKTYGEFDPSLDKVAAYGIGGLIAGKLLLKVGFFKLLLKPLLFVGALVIGAVAKLMGRKKAAPAAAAQRSKS